MTDAKTIDPAPNDIPQDPLWYKDAIIYEMHIKAFADGNDDGIGDFAGLTAKLDYIQELGVTALWILPFYPSPLRDDGYDIADYRNVNPAYGNLEEFKTFVAEAHKRGLHIITELVINHTSDQHPWFQRARHAPPGSKERDYYVWSDSDQKYKGTRIIFSDTEKSNWAWDPVAQAYYWHRFFSHQPDLNFENPDVLNEIIDIMCFWLEMGVDGLRLDAVPYLCEREGTNNENLSETHDILKKIRKILDDKYPGRMLLAEANQWPEDVLPYFGQGDECHMAFHFPLMPRIYMSIALEDRHPVTDIMYQTPAIPENCQWAFFLRNHDELTLEMVTDRERDYLWNYYAADKRARINFGIRRRLAPLMDNDRRKIELLNSLLLSMPGTPILYYGDELGMGDNIYLGDRDGVRTPMQWSPDRNAGFSHCDPARLYLPAIMDSVYGFQSINVETQRRVQYSLLNWMRKLISVVKSSRMFGRGNFRFLSPNNRTVLAYLRQYEGQTVLCVANLSRSPQAVELDMAEFKGLVPVEMLWQSRFPMIGDLPYLLTLSPYGFYWFQLTQPEQTQEQPAYNRREFLTLVMPDGWNNLFSHDTLAKKLLPDFLMSRRWYKGKNAGLPQVEIVQIIALTDEYRLVCLVANPPDGPAQHYIMGLGIAWDEGVGDDPMVRLHNDALCRVRRFNRVGVLYEAMVQENFVAALLQGFATKTDKAEQDNALQYVSYGGQPAFADMAIKNLGAEQTNTSFNVGDVFIFKCVRQPQPGISVEEEMSHFLSEVAPFERTPHLRGSLRLKVGEQSFLIGIMHDCVRNQGDGWKVTLAYLDHLIKDADRPASDQKDAEVVEDNYYAKLAVKLGERTGEMHKALAASTGNADFQPESVSAEDRMQWIEGAVKMLVKAIHGVEHARTTMPSSGTSTIDAFLSRRDEIEKKLRLLLPETIAAAKVRVHGDYHLGQVLLSDNDFYIIDFEGEPLRTADERRQKLSPLKDVAGMIRSFDYAAATALQATKLVAEDEREKIAKLLAVWRGKTEQSFIDGYRHAFPLPDSDAAFGDALAFFKLEKALYEVAYECAHRPDWIDIPLRNVLELIDGENP